MSSFSSGPEDEDKFGLPLRSLRRPEERAREARKAPRRPRWGPAPGARAEIYAWAKRVLEHPSSRLTKSIELSLVDVTCYPLELVARCCSHVEIVAASGVSVRSFAGLLWHMLEHGGKDEGFHELATPNKDEHEEQLRALAAPELPRRRAKPFDHDEAQRAEAVAPIAVKKPVDDVLERARRELGR